MTVFYKATRPGGTDFRTGTIHYRVGATVEHPTTKRFSDMRPNEPGTYLSVSVEPGEALTGGSWPCRMFRVEPVGRTIERTDGQLPYKRGCCALRLLEELPAHTALGPNGEAVAALIERARRLTFDELCDLDAARRDAAWDAVLALLVRDLISPQDFDVLYGPWASVVDKNSKEEKANA